MCQVAFPTKIHKKSTIHHLVVRPINIAERSQWDTLMAKHHYLGFKSLVGKSIRYVAEIQGQWVALLGWSAAALKCKPRDSWIGWPQVTQWQRLHLIANNSRFLILLPCNHIPNLASKTLSLNLKRLAKDWEDIHGHPIVLVETFVDSSRFAGTCYKAANWIYLGQTKGFGKSSNHYFHHGQPKAVFVRSLHKKAVRWLTEPIANPKLIQKVAPMNFTKKQLKDLIEVLKSIPDPRKKRGKRHRIISIMAIAICAVLCGARSYTAIAEWAQHRTQNQLRRLWSRYDDKKRCYIPPSEPTIRRVLQSNYHPQRRWLVFVGPGRYAVTGLFEKRHLFLLYLFFIFFLVLDVFSNLFLIQPNGTHAITSAPQMPTPISLSKVLVSLK